MRRMTLTGLAIACTAGAALAIPVAADTTSVAVRDSFYSPKAKTIQKGDTVRFRWRGTDIPHNVKFTRVPSGARKPRSCSLRKSGSCSRTFRRRGTFRYICTLHLESDGMRGSIRVE